MATVNIRVDAETAAFLERTARQTGRTESEIVRQALAALRELNAQKRVRPADLMADLIGSWDSGGMQLSANSGKRFTRMLKERQHEHDIDRHRPTRRAH
jgi:hypothetical protein